jgi:protein-disulfide isomerase
MTDGTNATKSSTAISIAVAILVIVGIFFLGPRFGVRAPQPQDVIPSNGASNGSALVDDDVVLGNPNAPVTVVEFGDYQCPFCERLYSGAERQIRETYVKQGLVKFVYRDFPLDQTSPERPVPLHPYARAAAEAAECARDQDKFWEYHDYLFENQPGIPRMDFVAVAKTLGLQEIQFRSCIETRKYRNEVEKDLQDGIALGVRGTPATFVNGVLVTINGQSAGAAPFSIFQAAIEQALRDAQL